MDYERMSEVDVAYHLLDQFLIVNRNFLLREDVIGDVNLRRRKFRFTIRN